MSLIHTTCFRVLGYYQSHHPYLQCTYTLLRKMLIFCVLSLIAHLFMKVFNILSNHVATETHDVTYSFLRKPTGKFWQPYSISPLLTPRSRYFSTKGHQETHHDEVSQTDRNIRYGQKWSFWGVWLSAARFCIHFHSNLHSRHICTRMYMHTHTAFAFRRKIIRSDRRGSRTRPRKKTL